MGAADLIGRDRERRALEELIAPAVTGPGVLVVVGEQGSGRSSLVALARELAASAGRRALRVDAVPGEETIPLSGLSQLLLPFAPQIESLSEAHRQALHRPLGLVSQDEPFDLVATGMAVVALMTQRTEAPALFVAVDDADRVDAATLSVLAFVSKRMDRQRALLLLTAEPHAVPPQFERDAATVRIGPLSPAESLRLLERGFPALNGPSRQQIVEQSAGNPLALLQTAAAAFPPPTASRPQGEPLRVGTVIEERVMARFRQLPEKTRERLIDAAVAHSYVWRAASSTARLRDPLSALAPAEDAGLVRIDQSGVTFAHPAYWIAIYHSIPYNDRVQSHRRIIESLSDRPAERAWHLGRVTEAPDETVAAQLEFNAGAIGRQLGRVEEALALERAADLSEENDQSARRFLAAAATAAPTGELKWVDELIARGMERVQDPQLRTRLTITSAWADAARGRFSAAMAALTAAASETADSAPEAAWEVLSIAAAYGYQSGNRATQAQLTAVVRHLAASESPMTPQQEARSLWVESYLRPGRGSTKRVARIRHLADEAPTETSSLSRLAGAAWLDDETETAFDLADAAYHRLVDRGAYAAAALLGPIRSWTAWDTGRWEEAVVFAEHASHVAEAAGGGMLQSTGDAVAALVHAARGDSDEVAKRIRAALALIDGEECRSIEARVEQALGLSDLVNGNYPEAYGHLSRLFREDGAPLHWHISYFGIADLASAALRADEVTSGRALLSRILEGFPPEPVSRMSHLLLRAKALLSESDDDAERYFSQAQADASGSRWPFERAQLLLDYGSWLRRQRRVNDAKSLLMKAHEMFLSLGALSWADRAAGELRASHVDVQHRAGSLNQLTAQQREIVLLAGQGLTNREIAARMYLSPRTVASHLYRSFPKLGIRDRWQLRDVIDEHHRPEDGPLESTSVG